MRKEWKEVIEAVGDRPVAFDRISFFERERAWADLADKQPLAPETTGRYFDLVAETKLHVAEFEYRKENETPSRWQDLATADLETGISNAMEFLAAVATNIPKEKSNGKQRQGSTGKQVADPKSGKNGTAGKEGVDDGGSRKPDSPASRSD